MLDRFKAQLNLLSVLHVFGVVPTDMNMKKYKNTVKKQNCIWYNELIFTLHLL